MFSQLITFINLMMTTSAMYSISHEYVAKSYNYRQRFLVLHYTACDLKKSLEILTGDSVSAHYVMSDTLISGKRVVYSLVPEEKRAWTQGVSYWRGRNNLNDQGVSLEIVNLGYIDKNGSKQWFHYPDHQIESVIELSRDIIARYDIEPTNVIGHADVSPGRKVDPGPLFPWEKLYNAGVGAWPDKIDVDDYKMKNTNVDIKDFQLKLEKYGYDVNTDGNITSKTTNAVMSFQMHFRPTKYNGVIDVETAAILEALIKKYREYEEIRTNKKIYSRIN